MESRKRQRRHETDDESDLSEHEMKAPAAKKPSEGKQKFLKEYESRFPGITESAKGLMHAFCNVCRKDFGVAHSGAYDIQRHLESAGHKAKAVVHPKADIKHFFVKCATNAQSKEAQQESVTRAEMAMAEMIAKFNLPLQSSETLVAFCKQAFPDSGIAQGMQCGRSKTTALIDHMAQSAKNQLIKRMRDGPFTLSTDGSNDAEAKEFPIVIRTVNMSTGKVTSELLAIAVCTGSATGENIFNLLDREIGDRRVKWTNCLSLGCDNANVMTGIHKGVFAFIKKKHEHLYLAGCTLHMLHNGARKAATVLPKFEEILVDIYQYFHKSSTRADRFRQEQLDHGLGAREQKKNLKHVPTRWLSITRCLGRLLENWDPLKTFFFAEAQELKSDKLKMSSYSQQKVESILEFIRSPTNKLYALFLQFVHEETYEAVLVTFQAEDPKIYELRGGLMKLMKRLLCFFVRAEVVMKAGCDLKLVNFMATENLKSKEEVNIGEGARRFIQTKDANHLRDHKVEQFFADVLKYYQTVCEYLFKRFPLDDPVLRHAEVVDVRKQVKASSISLDFFLTRFPVLLPKGTSKQQIVTQFMEYQCDDMSANIKPHMDETWAAIATLKDCTGQWLYKELAEVMMGILTLPHSSAHCERVFSCVRKNKTDQRASLGRKTLESLLVLKSRPDCPWPYSVEDVRAAKSCYTERLKQYD